MKKSYIKLLILIEIIGLVMQGFAVYETYRVPQIQIERPEDDKSKKVKLFAKGDGQSAQIDFSVMAKKPSDEEAEMLCDRAKSEIDESFFGDNASADSVWRRLCLSDSYADGLVEADWDFVPRGIVDATGNIDYERFDDRQMVTATCTLSVDERVFEYSFPFVAVQPDMGSADGFLLTVKDSLEKLNRDNAGDRIELPKEIGGKAISWKKPMDFTGLLLCVLGLVTGAALYIGSDIDSRKDAEKLRDEYGRQYPDIVENLGLYVGAGISVRVAFEKMEAVYIKWKAMHGGKEKKAYENLIVMNRAIRDGKLENEAYESFGKSCMHPSYRKLAILLKQNQKRGNDRLLEQLSHEEQLVAETRRRQIKSAGELISTKLLIPMGGLLGMILIVLIVPALQSIKL